MIFPINNIRLVTYEDSSSFFDKIENVKGNITCFILDIHISPYTGFEMLEMLKNEKKYRKIPVIALTASVTKDEVKLLRDSGFSGAMSKPIDTDLFPKVIERIVFNDEIVWAIG